MRGGGWTNDYAIVEYCRFSHGKMIIKQGKSDFVVYHRLPRCIDKMIYLNFYDKFKNIVIIKIIIILYNIL